MKKFISLLSFVFVFFSFYTNVFALTENITQINFTSASQSITLNTVSSVISIQTQNVVGNEEQTTSVENGGVHTHLNITSSSATGEFSSNANTWESIKKLTLNSGTANRNFYYKDSTPGTYTITVSVEGNSWTPVTQNIVVVGNPVILSNIAITTPETKLNYNVGEVLDISGLVVTGTYSDSTTKIESITSANITGFDSSAPTVGRVLTITIGEKTATYTITVNAIPNTTSPTISLFYPTDNETNVLVNVQPTLTFSEAIDTSTMNGVNIKLREYATLSDDAKTVPALLTYSAGNKVTFILSSPLKYNKQYYFWVGTGVKDIVGNSFAADTWYHTQRANHEFTTIAENIPPTDITPPVVKLLGDVSISILKDSIYTDAGATATDDMDSSVIVTASGVVDVATAGVYTITYMATDTAGNIATPVTRTINVNIVSDSGGGGGNPEVTKNIHLKIETNDNSIYDKDISVVPCDDKGIESITAYCALDQLEKSGILPKSDWSGLWINSIDGIVNNENNNGIYWMWLVNSNTTPNPAGFSCSQDYPYSCSAKEYFLKNNDQILFYYKPFVDPIDDSNPEVITPVSSGGGSSHILNNKFDVDKALAYLISKQNSDSSFISPMYTDWVSLAIASTNTDLVSKEKVTNYLKTTPLTSSTLTDNERHTMALMALGINPYNGTEINYIKKITDSFDGTQFGDKNLVNDDIFALIPLVKVGYNANDEMITKDIDFILSKQNLDGSWEGSVDITSAAVQSLKPFDSVPSVSSALIKAGLYIKNKQENNGGWGNVSSSSWATQAMNVLGESWVKEGKTATDYFNEQQDADGAVLPSTETLENRIWATSYAIPAVMNKTWESIMQSFQKPVQIVEVKKEVLKAKSNIQNVKNPDIFKESLKFTATDPKPLLSSPTENNLGASVGNAVPVETSIKEISHIVVRSVISMLTYIGKGFVDLIIFLQSHILAVFK